MGLELPSEPRIRDSAPPPPGSKILSQNLKTRASERQDDVAGSNAQLEDSAIITDGNWHLLVGTNNPGVHTPRLYVDGTLKLTSAVSVGALETGGIAIPLEIGRMFRQGWGSPGNYFPGSIDEVRIYDSMPTGSQVTGLYTANTPVRPVSWGSIKGRYR